MFPLNSFVLAGGLGFALVAGVAGYSHGRHVSKLECEQRVAQIQEALDKAKADYQQLQKDQAVKLEQTLSDYAATQKDITRETQKIIVRPVYRNVCLDADGLRQLDRARLGGKSSASQPASKMP